MSKAPSFKYVSRKRRVREDRRFVAGKATFVADVTPVYAARLTFSTSSPASSTDGSVKIDANAPPLTDN